MKRCFLALLLAIFAAQAAAVSSRAARARDASARPGPAATPAPSASPDDRATTAAAAWSSVYSGGLAGKEERLADVLPAADGGYFVLGETDAFGAGGADVWALRLNAAGEPVWQYAYGGAGAERARRLWPTADGGCVLLAETQSFGAGGWDAWVLKLDARGRVEWQKTLGGAWDDAAVAVAPAEDGALLFAGHVAYATPTPAPTPTPQPGKKEKKREKPAEDLRSHAAWVFKLKADGSLAWQRQFRDGDADPKKFESTRASALAPAGDGGYLVGCYAGTSSRGRGLIFKIAADGSLAPDPAVPGSPWAYWYHTPGSEAREQFCYEENCIPPPPEYVEFRSEVFGIQAGGGGFLIAGERWAVSRTQWVARLDGDGRITRATDLRYAFDWRDSRPAEFARAGGGYFLSGLAGKGVLGSLLSRKRDLAVLKLDESGGALWKRVVKASDVRVAILNASEDTPKLLIRALPSGGYLMARHLDGKTKEWRGKRPADGGGLVLAKWDETPGAAGCLSMSDAKTGVRPLDLRRTPAAVAVRPAEVEARPGAGRATETSVRRAPACQLK